jgi:hypothetical protein
MSTRDILIVGLILVLVVHFVGVPIYLTGTVGLVLLVLLILVLAGKL